MKDKCPCGSPGVWFSLRKMKYLCANCEQLAREEPVNITKEDLRKALDWVKANPTITD